MMGLRKLVKPLYLWAKRLSLRLWLATRPLSVLPGYRTIMVVAPHPDDEILGLGGYLIRQLARGCRVVLVYLTNGEKSLEEIAPEVVAGQRRRLGAAVQEELGLASGLAVWCGFPDGAVPGRGAQGFDAAVDRIAAIARDVDPDAMFVTHPQETWPYDHVAAFDIVSEALKRSSSPCDLYGYWVWLWYSMPLRQLPKLGWRGIVRIPVHEELQKKRELMGIYLTSQAPNGRPWSGVLPHAMTRPFMYPFEVTERF